MDADRFDRLARAITAQRSRRGVTRALTGLTLGGMLGPLLGVADSESRKKKKKGKGKKKKGGVPISPDPLSPPPGPTCSDGATNGSETDVDCGGDCPRCALDRTCTSRNDCVTALCKNSTCHPCSDIPVPGGPTTNDCGQDVNGKCNCRWPATGGSAVCYQGVPTGNPVFSCASCAPGTYCFSAGGAPEIFTCRKPCGAS
jgi:hypothetical protein